LESLRLRRALAVYHGGGGFSSCSGPSGFIPSAGAATIAGLLVGFPGEGELDLIAFSERSEVLCAYSQDLVVFFFLFGPTCNV
jgi:hypothetical protein